MEKEFEEFEVSPFVTLITVVIVGWLMIIGSSFLQPLAWSFLFTFVALPITEFLEQRKWKRSLAILASLIIMIVIFGGILYFLVNQTIQIAKHLPSISAKLDSLIDQVDNIVIKFFGLSLPDETELKEMVMEKGDGMLGGVIKGISGIGEIAMYATLMPIYIFFFLYYRDLPYRFLEARFKQIKQNKILEIFSKIQGTIRDYLIGTLFFTLVTVIFDVIILWIMGIQYALFFAVFIAILNLIPYVGNLIAFIVVFLFTFLTEDSLTTSIILMVLLTIANTIQENVLRPWLIGSSMSINAFAVFLSVILGGLLWGVSGMILFIPLIGIMKIILESTDEWKPWAIFFGDHEPPKQENETSKQESEK